jgi:hypothetical protein
MGEGAEGIAAGSRSSENNGFGSCEAHDVAIGTSENCGGAAGAVGENTVEAEKGWLDHQPKSLQVPIGNQFMFPASLARPCHLRRRPSR